MNETTHTADPAVSGGQSAGMFAAAVHNPSHTKTDRELRESHQDLRESRQDLRQVDQDLQQTSQDLRETSQNSREYGQNIRESWQDLRQVDQDLQQTSQDLRESRLELLESEERFRLLVESSTDCAIYMLDPEGKVVKWNDGAERSQGYKAEEILGRNYSVLFAPEDAEAGVPAQELAVAARDGRFETAAWRQRKNGARFWALVTLTAIRGPEGELRGFSKVTRDMTAQRAVEESLRIHNAQLERFRVIVENVADYVVFTLDAKGRFDSWSPGALNILGFTAEEALGREYSLTFTKAEIEAEEPRREIEEAARNGHCATENWQIRKDGSLFWSSGVLTAIKDRAGKVTGYIRVASDMTAQKRLEEAQLGINAELEIRVAERTRELKVLLREVYHRVKNNLQVIQSLLKMRARLLPEGETRVAIDSTVQRIYAMSLAHEHLYRMDDLTHLSLSKYLQDLFRGVEASSSAQPGQIQLQLDTEEIFLTLDHAIPFGLLANELLSNSFKHGFPEGRKGTIKLSVHRLPNSIRMVVKDNGIGLPASFDRAKGASMGLKLATSLAHQLGGSLEFSSDEGCRVQADLARL